jgi:hypothetical protein
VRLPDSSVEQVQFPLQSVSFAFGQGLKKVLQHCAQPPGDLKVLGSVQPDFPAGQLHEAVPVWGFRHNLGFASGICDDVVMQMPTTDDPQRR